MIAPSKEILLNVTINVGGTDRTFLNVAVKDEKDATANLNALDGYAHPVTLNIVEPESPADNSKALTVKATVNEWKTGNSGSADLK